ncbi:MAG: Ig-like domain-containing protein [Proteobacteria bacterium]|nr:Ig-like domain-containing protein [Pseudomonadota bacterium]
MVQVSFNEEMNAATVNGVAFFLRDSGFDPVPGTINYSGTTAYFTPTVAFDNGESYTATVTTGVEDTNGNALTTDISWSFTTSTIP